jgi:hypothetical protein
VAEQYNQPFQSISTIVVLRIPIQRKFMKLTALLIVSIFVFQSTKADDYHPSREENYWAWGHWNAVDPDFSTNELARQSGSTEFDPNGNWGDLTNQAQASLRFPKDAYTNGEPVVATILIRNYSTNTTLKIPCEVTFMPMKFIIVDKTGMQLKPKESSDPIPHPIISGTFDDGMAQPMEQARFKERIDADFDFSKPGTYTIYGWDDVAQADINQKTSIKFVLKSGKATIHIVAPPQIRNK